ncbi:hypothetical protein [Rhizobium bangladeshense]|uniref:hypothetical protein n=1 Tax=Rhizobium bangladeshense TaxID=1138189 RepID=UPI0012E8AD14|nr:hypothetical protein [Rhizobium bangladeshense]
MTQVNEAAFRNLLHVEAGVEASVVRAHLSHHRAWAFFIGIAAFLTAEQAVEADLSRKLAQSLLRVLLPEQAALRTAA